MIIGLIGLRAYFHSSHGGGANCSSMVERPLVMRWVNGSIRHGGPIELFLILTSVKRQCNLLSSLLDVHVKDAFLLNGKRSSVVAAVGFLCI